MYVRTFSHLQGSVCVHMQILKKKKTITPAAAQTRRAARLNYSRKKKKKKRYSYCIANKKFRRILTPPHPQYSAEERQSEREDLGAPAKVHNTW